MWSETLTKTVLENCLRLTVLEAPRSRTVSLGLFVDHGAKDEEQRSSGISHFIEHLVFNPAHMEPRARRRLGELMDRGASYEAYTGKEFTRCSVTCRRADLDPAIACLGSMLSGARILPEAVEHERAIILQERETYISSGRMKEELIEQALWGDRSLGLFVIGRKENIARFNGSELEPRLERFYTPQNTQLVVLGDVRQEDVVRSVEEHFGHWMSEPSSPPSILIEEEPNIIALPSGGARSDLTLAFLGPAFNHPDRYAMNLLGDILGGGIKSRLFAEVRERRELCYAIYAYSRSYRLGGYLAINANAAADKVDEVFRSIMGVIDGLKEHQVPDDELERVREARITSLMETTGDTRRYLQQLGKYAMNGKDFFVDWEAHELRRVTPADVQRVARTMLTTERLAITGIGVDGEALMRLL
ncbi:MAG: M16 family metallopeptidase [Bacillota bacterium]